MLEKDAHEAIMLRWKAGWEALFPLVPWTQPGELFDAVDEWARVTVSPASSRLATLGSPIRRERRGVVGVNLFTLPLGGPARLSELADGVRAVLEAQSIPSISGDGEAVIMHAGASHPPITDGKWLTCFVTVDYEFYDVR